VHSDAVIIGIGINITMAGDELPTAEAISLAQLSVQVSREPLIAAILDGLAGISADASLDRYREFCVTIGALVEVSRISDEPLQGLVVGIDESGALRLLAAGVEHSVTVGDVRHLRPGT
jgi:BirA family biotin operon repressor/biotin-[acetyl-CoA-carboxylase] ligase